ncbi:MAG: hypothetical protein Q9159_005645 [Coniocarpon cinnabarinum]
MPLSLFTRRGSKKASSKAPPSREASVVPQQKEGSKRNSVIVDSKDTAKAPTAPATSVKRRVTESLPDGGPTPDDVFLNLANDDEPKVKTRSRSKSAAVEPQKATAASSTGNDSSNPLKYLSSLSQRPTRPQDSRHPTQEDQASLQTADRPDYSSVNSRAPQLHSANATVNNGRAQTEQSGNRFSSTAQYKTPSPTRRQHHLSELPKNTRELYDTVSPGPKSAPLDPGSKHWLNQVPDDLESHASTAAQSGLWDELHELKSRMRKLESNSARSRYHGVNNTESTTGFERPRTSTTHTTTSASRRSSNNDHLSSTLVNKPQPPANEGTEIHPLLHSALRKARLVVSPDVFKALETSASDALQLANIARTSVEPLDLQSMAATTLDTDPERNLKRVQRRADNLCRSLTELCIVLCEQARASSSSGGVPPRSPYDSTKPPPSALTGVHLSAQRPSSSGRPYAKSEIGTPPTTHLNGYSDSPTTALDSRRALADRINRLQNRANARSLDSRAAAGRANSVVETSASTWTSKPHRAATTAARSTYNDMPQDPADLVDDSSASAASSSVSDDDNALKNNTLRATRAQTEPPAPVANMARRTINAQVDPRNHSPRDLRLSKDYTQRHPLPEGLSPSLRKALENKNGSSPSVASSRTTRAASVTGGSKVNTPTVNGASSARRMSARTTEIGVDDEDAISPTTKAGDRESRRGSARKDRLPPSTGAGLAERLEMRRRMRMEANERGSSDE